MENKKNILIVDDEKDILEILSYNLIKENYNVITSTNGADALLKVNKELDLIILDVMMPKMNGFEFLEAYRKDFENQAPVVVITGADLDEEDKKFLSSETSRVLEKSSMSDTGIADHLVKTIESVAGVAK